MRSKNRWLVKLASAALALALLAGGAVFAAPRTGAATLQQQLEENLKQQEVIKQKIASLKADKAAKQQLSAQYNAQIANLQQRIDLCNELIQQCNDEITRLEGEIAAKNEEIADEKELFKRRLRAIQMSGDTASLTLLLGADDLADFLKKAQLARSVSKYDKKIIDELAAALKKIQEDEKEVEAKKAEQDELAASLGQSQSEYRTLVAELKTQIAGVDAALAAEEKELQRQQQAEAELEASMRGSQGVAPGLTFTSFGFQWPLDTRFHTITSPFGWRRDPFTGKSTLHKGTDISGSGINRQPIYASAAGQVSVAKFNAGGYGYYVTINHGTYEGNYYQTLYGHMTRYIVSVGQYVAKGQIIGYVGSTGASTGPHLHFEVRLNYNPVNAMNYVSWH